MIHALRKLLGTIEYKSQQNKNMVISNRTELINYIILENRYKSYLEIGTANPDVNFNMIVCDKKYSVDTGEHVEGYSDEMTKNFQYTHKMTSDDFFIENEELFDVIFVDGLHTEEQCSKDIWNALTYINDGGMVIVHDTMPESENMTGDEPRDILWQGNCWKPIHRLVNMKQDVYDINTFYMDWGITIIKNVKEPETELFGNIFNTLIKEPEPLEYNTDFYQVKLKPTYQVSQFIKPKVSYFTSLYNSNIEMTKRVYECLKKQTNDSWEWICIDDSPSPLSFLTDMVNDSRVKYYRFNSASRGVIGEAKYRAAMMCTGTYLAELDHDDLILPEMTDYLLRYGLRHNADFIYTDSAEIYYNIEDNSITCPDKYPEGAGMGYYKYYQTDIKNPVNDKTYTVNAILCPPLNPKTLRHIVSVPNHIRCWKKDFYMKIGGHNRNLPIADDYELILRTVLNGGVCLHLNWCGYMQTIHSKNTTGYRRNLIQDYVKAIMVHYDSEINKYFQLNDPNLCNDKFTGDWAGRYLKDNFRNNVLMYAFVPNFKELYPNLLEPNYKNLLRVSVDI